MVYKAILPDYSFLCLLGLESQPHLISPGGPTTLRVFPCLPADGRFFGQSASIPGMNTYDELTTLVHGRQNFYDSKMRIGLRAAAGGSLRPNDEAQAPAC